jgi:ribose transport system substrate-binding protein
MKRALTIFLVIVLLVGTVGCTSTPEATPAAATEAPAAAVDTTEAPSAPAFKTGYKIGMNLFMQGAYVFDTMVRQTNVLVEDPSIQGSLMLFNDEANIEKITTDVENMINSGVDGAMWWAIIPTHYAVGPQMFEDAGLPFVLFDAYPGWPDGNGMVGKETVRSLSTFAGVIGCSNYQSGEEMAKQALADGRTNAIIMANVMGSGVGERADGFQATFEAGGGKVLEVSHEGTASNAHIAAMQNLFATYPEADCLYSVGADFTLGALSVVENLGRDVGIYGTDVTPDLLSYLVEGKVSALGGAHWVDSVLCNALLINALDGHKILDTDGLPLWFTDFPMPVIPAKYAALYNKFWVEEMPLSYSDISQLLYRNNPDVTAQDFIDFINNYTIENVLKQKYAEGKVTADELAAVGITVG